MKSLVKRENYINIQGWMLTELNLKGNEILIYAIIYGFSQDESSSFRGSLQYLADWTNSTKQGVFKNLQNLLEKKLIIKKEEFRNNIKLVEYHCTKVNTIKQSLTPMQQSLMGGIKQSLTNTIELDNITDIQDCNAVQSNFSKNEEEVLEIPSASSRNISASSHNSSSSEIPNNSTSAKNAQVQNPEISLADFKTEWYKITPAEPKQGFQKSYDNFLKFYSKMTADKKAYYKDWQGYLKERWVGQEIGLILSKVQNEEGIPSVYNTAPIELVKEPEKFWEKFLEISADNPNLKKSQPHLTLKGIREKTLIFEMSKEKIQNFEGYHNQFSKVIKKVYEKVYDVKIKDYVLQPNNI